MSQCKGVNIYASGDYLVDERQSYLCTSIERLRVHMVTLKEKLEEEKMLLSELKAETQYLSMYRTENLSSLSEMNLPKCSNNQSKRIVSQSSLAPSYNMSFGGEVAKVKRPVEEPKQNFDRTGYVNRLREIDSLCKEEMARMNSVVEQMEPLKQIASDWMLETRLKEATRPPAVEDLMDREQGTAQFQHPALESNRSVCRADVIVVPPERPVQPTPVFVPESKCDAQLDPSVLTQAQFIKCSKSKPELKASKEPQLKQDSLLKPTSQTNPITDTKNPLVKRKKVIKTKNSSSEVSLSSLEALKEKNITLIDMNDGTEKRNSKKLQKKAEDDRKLTASRMTSKSAISLESIQRAFANYHKKKRKATKGGTNALNLFQSPKKSKGEEDLKREQELFAYLHPNAKKIVKNWVMVGRKDKKQVNHSVPKRKAVRAKRCTLNLGRNKDAELSLCEDDVINKYLYDEDGYVYTPLFISETEDEGSSDADIVGEM